MYYSEEKYDYRKNVLLSTLISIGSIQCTNKNTNSTDWIIQIQSTDYGKQNTFNVIMPIQLMLAREMKWRHEPSQMTHHQYCHILALSRWNFGFEQMKFGTDFVWHNMLNLSLEIYHNPPTPPKGLPNPFFTICSSSTPTSSALSTSLLTDWLKKLCHLLLLKIELRCSLSAGC